VAASSWRRITARMRASSSRGLKGLGEVVVRAELEPQDAVDLVVLGGQHDDRQLRLVAQLPGEPEAVLAGQLHVEDDQVRTVGLEEAVHLLAVGRRHHLVVVVPR
jgi:hypothetical protein